VALKPPDGAPAAPAEGRRGELIRIAGEVFSRAGYSRTSLRDIAEAAGILTGSLYHHFPSKESLAIELISAFHAEVDALAFDPRLAGADPVADLVEFADKVGRVVERHRAALMMSMYDAPSAATDALSGLVGREPASLVNRWGVLLDAARAAGRLRPELDLPMLRSVLPTAVLDLASLAGIGPIRDLVSALTSLLLHGIAVSHPVDRSADLDGSAASAVMREVVASWAAPGPESDTADRGARRGQILDAARREFARRGYEATTVRDVARAAGIRPSSLYRHFASKQEILDAIIERYSRLLRAGFEAVVAAPGDALQRLDALMGLMAAAAARFRAEFAILKDWWRALDPAVGEAPDDNVARLRLLQTVIDDGLDAGLLARPADPALMALALRGALWVPLAETGPVAVGRRHAFMRLCVLDGAAVPGAEGDGRGSAAAERTAPAHP
jgi:AcrR family transcriptional regulator